MFQYDTSVTVIEWSPPGAVIDAQFRLGYLLSSTRQLIIRLKPKLRVQKVL